MRILLLTLASAAAGLAAQPFSHRVHPAAKLDCAVCHPAALTSTRAGDNLLPKPAVCLTCHKSGDVGMPPPANIARFNHQLHLKLGNIGPVIAAAIDRKAYLWAPPANWQALRTITNPCEACHRGLDTADTPERNALAAMADCLVCHTQVDPPYSCEYCHGKNANLKPASHTRDFLDTHTSGKLALDKTTCAVCHGRKFHCLGCH